MSLPQQGSSGNGTAPARSSAATGTSPNTSGVETSSQSSSPKDGSSLPAVTVPSGGGTIRGMNEAFDVNLSTGSASLKVDVPVTEITRWGTPSLSLDYDSGSGNGIFGLGWALIGVPSIVRKTSHGVPTYNGEEDAFVYGGDELVPLFEKVDGEFKKDSNGQYIIGDVSRGEYSIRRYSPRVEHAYDRIERWTKTTDPNNVHWRVTSPTNETQIYGRTQESRTSLGYRIFEWHICEAYDGHGGAQLFEWKLEDSANVNISSAHERNRTTLTRRSCPLLKRIKYGNKSPNRPSHNWSEPVFPAKLDPNTWMFELVFDYGEHNATNPQPDDDLRTPWHVRTDPYSSYTSGFEVRTYRLCKRLLMFHNFPEELKRPHCLVSSLELTYKETSAISFLQNARHVGYKLDEQDDFIMKALPPLNFEYSKVPIELDMQNLSLQPFDSQSLENLTVGVTGSLQWLDLLGDGTTGILDQDMGAWYYKRNLSVAKPRLDAVLSNMESTVDISSKLGSMLIVSNQPNMESDDRSGISTTWADVDNDGIADLLVIGNGVNGFYQGIRQIDGSFVEWQAYRPFESWPNIDMKDANTRMIDLTGDGCADILITHDDKLIWYCSLGAAGFGPPQEVVLALDEERGPRILFSDPTQSIYLADMSGDGLIDITRVMNGQICYWPNMGHGHFGAKVTMDNAPIFDTSEGFSQSSILLADTDGSGTSDIFYFRPSGGTLFYNQAGNSCSAPVSIDALVPQYDSLKTVAAVDLFGNGTTCLVCSSQAAVQGSDPSRSLMYVDLMNGLKPHLLTSHENNMGSRTMITYRSSTAYYLMDEEEGTPWATKLPFPVQCVDTVLEHDLINCSLTTERYVYHHGYYDGIEREFRGFGMTEHWDTEDFGVLASIQTPSLTNQKQQTYVSPVRTKVWLHIGAFGDAGALRNVYGEEFYKGSGEDDAAFSQYLADDNFLKEPGGSDYSSEELRQAAQAMKGMEIHMESYCNDMGTDIPFEVVSTGNSVRMIQPQGPNSYAIFQCFKNESLTVNFDNDAVDLSAVHDLSLEVDDFGNVTKHAKISYGRCTHRGLELGPDDRERQQATLIIYTETGFTNSIATLNDYVAPHPSTEDCSQVYGLVPTNPGRFTHEDFAAVSSYPNIEYHVDHPPTSQSKRLISRNRILYRKDNLQGLLAQSELEPLALRGQSYDLCLTPSMRTVYSRQDQNIVPQTFEDAGYVDLDGDSSWWLPGGSLFYSSTADDELAEAMSSFFQPKKNVDPFQAITETIYDAYNLVPVASVDAMRNQTSATIDYRLLAPSSVTDANGNRTDFARDALGIIVGMAVVAKGGEGTDSLVGFDADLTPEAVNAFLADPLEKCSALLADATIRVVYDQDAYLNSKQPVVVSTISAITHGQHVPDANSPVRPSQMKITYQDAEGRAIQQKSPTISDKWRTSGWSVFNNKGLTVQNYEPFFDESPAFKFDARAGNSSMIFYDGRNRHIATLHPDHTWTKVDYKIWSTVTYDENDLVLRDPSKDADIGRNVQRLSPDAYLPTWYDSRKDLPTADPERDAASKAVVHADTPEIVYIDSSGQTFLSIQNTGAALLERRRFTDIQGYETSTKDPLGRIVDQTWYDMLGRPLLSKNLDHGTSWTFLDIRSRVVYNWTGSKTQLHGKFDLLGRPTDMLLKDGDGAEKCVMRTTYGESLNSTFAKTHNLLTHVYKCKDQSGSKTQLLYDLAHNCVSTQQQTTTEYKIVIDWDDQVDLNPTVLSTTLTYDALNRLVSTQTPDESITAYEYDINGLLFTVKSKAPAGEWIDYVSRIRYDEYLREVVRVQDQNNVTEIKVYDSLTRRLAGKIIRQGLKVLQNIQYHYDAAGNLVFQVDKSEQDIYFRNGPVSPSLEYMFDGVNRLVKAVGREHLGQTKGQVFSSTLSAGLHGTQNSLAPGDGSAVAKYIETYTYDGAGNMLTQKHEISDRLHPGWTRQFHYTNPSLIEGNKFNNRLRQSKIGKVTENYAYDESGNTLSMPGVVHATWDYQNHLRSTTSQATKGNKPETVWYVYDFFGNRVRKVVERQSAAEESRIKSSDTISIGAIEHYVKFNGQGQSVLECRSLHVQEEAGTVALVERWSGTLQAPKKLHSLLLRFQYHARTGSVTLELDDTGQMLSYEEYSPYGSTTYAAALAKAPKRFRFAAKERDQQTGFYYCEQRYYVPWLCRWLNPDPIGTGDGMNVYEYVAGNPVEYQDPDGTVKKVPDIKATPKTTTNKNTAKNAKKTAQDLLAALKKKFANLTHLPDLIKAEKALTTTKVTSNMQKLAAKIRPFTKHMYDGSHLIPHKYKDQLHEIIDVDLWVIRLRASINEGHMVKEFDTQWTKWFEAKVKVKVNGKFITMSRLQQLQLYGDSGDKDLKIEARTLILSQCRYLLTKIGYMTWDQALHYRMSYQTSKSLGRFNEKGTYHQPEWDAPGGGWLPDPKVLKSAAKQLARVNDKGYLWADNLELPGP